jgi:hypothetical protein
MAPSSRLTSIAARVNASLSFAESTLTSGRRWFASDQDGLLKSARQRRGVQPIPLTRALQLALAGLWLLDGILQCQPFMFTSGFLRQIIEPAAQGQPWLIRTSILGPAHFVSHHEAAFNAVFATVQLLLGYGILVRRTTKIGLVASISWALGVWWFGEGGGVLATGHAMLLTGAPGAALLYAVLAVLAWPEPEDTREGVARRALNRGLTARVAWALLWLGGAALSLLPVNLTSDGIHDAFAAGSNGEPPPISTINSLLAQASGGHGLTIGVGLAVLQALAGVGVFLRWWPRLFIVLGAVLAVVFWLTAEALGGIPTGQATDPNTGPVLLVLALAVSASFSGRPVEVSRSRLVVSNVGPSSAGECGKSTLGRR